jgi:4-nitrophenyl phosphatase
MMIETLNPPIRGAILDLDGTLWRGTAPIGDLPAIFARFEALSIRFILATNNATMDIGMYQDKVASYGVRLEHQQIINSGQAAAHLLHHDYPDGAPVYIVGEEGLHRALAEAGFVYSEGDDAVAVIAGMDRKITYEKIMHATLLIRRGVRYIGTNPDATFPMPGGKIIPGAGSILAAITTASGVQPTIAGKPSPAMFELALERMGTRPQETISVGDRLETDIAGGQNAGCRTALVLSGVTTLAQAQAWRPQPDLIAPDLTHILSESS